MLVSCSQCGKEFNKLPSQIKKTNNNFCSQSCAAIFNNAKYPKKHKIEKIKVKTITIFNDLECPFCKVIFTPKYSYQKYCSSKCANCASTARFHERQKFLSRKCKMCNIFISHHAITGYCKSCFDALRMVKAEQKTLKELKLERAGSNTYTRIRDNLANKFRRYVPNSYHKCFLCGEDEVYELCHIKPVSSFSDDTILKEINSFSNLVVLCPTHHWKYDHPDKCTIDKDKILSLDEWLKRDQVNLGDIYNKLFV